MFVFWSKHCNKICKDNDSNLYLLQKRNIYDGLNKRSTFLFYSIWWNYKKDLFSLKFLIEFWVHATVDDIVTIYGSIFLKMVGYYVLFIRPVRSYFVFCCCTVARANSNFIPLDVMSLQVCFNVGAWCILEKMIFYERYLKGNGLRMACLSVWLITNFSKMKRQIWWLVFIFM